jgi:predicted Zn-dependent protease
LWSLLLLGLVSYVVQPTYAATRPDKHIGDDFESFADQVFEEFFAETAEERRLLGAVAISIKEERRIGEASLQAFLRTLQRQKIDVSQRGKDAAYLKSLVAEIRPRMRNEKRYRSIRVYVAKTKATDAKAFPGGAIVCSTGLIEFAQSEAALLGVLAHELSHIDRGHQLRMARSQKLAQKTFAEGTTTFEEFAQTGTLLVKQFARPFRLEEEAEADLDAARWMFEIGYEPLEMAALFRRLDQRDQADQVRMPSFLRSHPYHAARDRAVQELASRLKEAKPDEKLYVGRKNIRQRITRRERQYPE